MGPTTPSLSVTRHDDVQFLLRNAAHRNVFPLMEHHVQQLFGRNNIGTLNGKEWRQQRTRIVKALHSPAVVRHHQESFQVATNQLVAGIAKKIRATESEIWNCKDLSKLIKGLTMDCFGRAAFSADFGTCRQILLRGDERDDDGDVEQDSGSLAAHHIGPAFDTLTADLMRRVTTDVLYPTSHSYFIPNSANRTYAQEKDLVLSFLTTLIQQRRRDRSGGANVDAPLDLLASFLEHFENSGEITSENKDSGDLAKEIAQSMLGLLFAGYETSSVSLTYCLYLLSQHPTVLANCQEEIQRIEKNKDGDCVYLQAVVKETLRLYPPAISTARTCDRDLELPNDDGTSTLIPKGIYLYFPLWVIQRDPRHFSNPLQFSPDRWVWRRDDDDDSSLSGNLWEVKEENDVDHTGGAWVAFSAGARSCPGQRFATQEMTTILKVLLPRLQFETPSEYVLEPHRDGFVQTPKGGIPMEIRLRS